MCLSKTSFWIIEAICWAYETSSVDTRELHRVRAHELRGLSAPWAFLRKVALEDIIELCIWKQHSTFLSHNLKDLVVISVDLLKPGPLMVAQYHV